MKGLVDAAVVVVAVVIPALDLQGVHEFVHVVPRQGLKPPGGRWDAMFVVLHESSVTPM
jgi:hypothetical protein